MLTPTIHGLTYVSLDGRLIDTWYHHASKTPNRIRCDRRIDGRVYLTALDIWIDTRIIYDSDTVRRTNAAISELSSGRGMIKGRLHNSRVIFADRLFDRLFDRDDFARWCAAISGKSRYLVRRNAARHIFWRRNVLRKFSRVEFHSRSRVTVELLEFQLFFTPAEWIPHSESLSRYFLSRNWRMYLHWEK